MAKFCGKCGSKLNEGGLCPKCDVVENNSVNQQSVVNENTFENRQVNQVSSVQTLENKPKEKKKKTGKKLIIAIASVLVVLVGTAGLLSYFRVVEIPLLSSLMAKYGLLIPLETTEKNNVIEYNGSAYYLSGGHVAKLEDDDSVVPVKCVEDGEEILWTSGLYLPIAVFDGDTIYCQYRDYRDALYKFTFKDDETLERSVWVDEETLNESEVVTETDCSDIGYTGSMTDWRLDGDYIYFINDPGPSYFLSSRDTAYRLGRISKDGSSIEFIGDETASCYTVKDDWIYYCDNGYQGVRYHPDDDRCGIYRIKGDGSEKEKIFDDFIFPEYVESNFYELCNKMELFGDYLYFLDCTDEGESRVCRIKTDGSDFEYVSENGAYTYTIDMENDTLYYITGEYGKSSTESRTVYKVNLDSEEEKVLFEYGNYGDPIFTVYNDYLYFNNGSYQFTSLSGNTDLVGLRYNLESGEIEKLFGEGNATIEHETVDNEVKFVTHQATKIDLYWETVDEADLVSGN